MVTAKVMKLNVSNWFFLFPACLFLCSCNQGPQPLDALVTGSIKTELNPYGKVPLGAQIRFATDENCTVEIEVLGKIPIKRTFSSPGRYHEIPVLGLYPDTTNTVRIQLKTENEKIYTGEVQIETGPLPEILPTIEVTRIERDKMEPGFHLIDMLIANNGKFLPYTIMFDDHGTIRWFMDMSSVGQIAYTNHRLKNGNWLYLSWINLIEVNDLGKVVREEQMWGHAGNHEIKELPDGTLLMGGSKKDAVIIRDGRPVPSRYDFAIIWDRSDRGRTIKEWDLREVLDVDRMVYPPDYNIDFASDWFHVNSIEQDPKDNSLIISGRNQGVLKVDGNNNLKWILAPHRGWGRAGYDGKGFETSEYLLTAVDANGAPFPPEIQEGRAGAEAFEWSTGQHAAKITENGNVVLFDNGLMRNFDPTPTYSRAVEYRIDEENRTIEQVWQYGKERGFDLYSPITSEIDLLPQTGNRLITAGNVRKSELPPHAKMVEITYPDNQVVFEANIFFKDVLGAKTADWAQFDLVFRGERYDLVEANGE